MRPDLVASGVATLVLMGISYLALTSATLTVPALMTNVALFVALIGAALIAIGIVLPRPSAIARRRHP